MTLDEWKREQEAKRAVPKYNLRKPGEGEDGNQWKKLYMLKKKVKEDDDDDEEEDDEDVDVIFLIFSIVNVLVFIYSSNIRPVFLKLFPFSALIDIPAATPFDIPKICQHLPSSPLNTLMLTLEKTYCYHMLYTQPMTKCFP